MILSLHMMQTKAPHGFLRARIASMAVLGALLLAAPAVRAAPRVQDMDPAFAPYASRTDAAVERAMAFLMRTMKADGSYDGQFGDTPGIMGLVGMAFLSAGHTPRDHTPEGRMIVRCIEYVLANQEKNGWMGAKGGQMYGHAICTLFLSEVSGMVEPNLQAAVTRAAAAGSQIIVAAQQVKKKAKDQGGWRYSAGSTDSDTSVSGWCFMAMRSARLNGAPVPEFVIKDGINYLLQSHRDAKTGTFGYQDGKTAAENMTGVALLCLELSGLHGSPATIQAGDYLLAHLSQIAGVGGNSWPEYGTYYASQAMFQLGGVYWSSCAVWLYETWLSRQYDNGSWLSPRNGVCAQYETAMIVLSLTVPYRQLPIYQRDETVDEY